MDVDRDQNQNSMCAYCDLDKECRWKCPGCDNLFYCSQKHLQLHWITHQFDCWPFKIVNDPGSLKGGHWIASRDLKPGEILIDEIPAFYGPLSTPNGHLCITCGLQLTSGPGPGPGLALGRGPGPGLGTLQRCSKCDRPVCSVACEKNLVHSSNECSWFTYEKNHKVYNPSLSDSDHLFTVRSYISAITLMIRGTRIKSRNNPLYTQLLKLQHSSPNDSFHNRKDMEARQFVKIFKHLVSPNQLELSDQMYIRTYHIFCLNAFRCNETFASPHLLSTFLDEISDYKITDDFASTSNHRSHICSAVYIKASRLNFSCAPNCTWTICPEQDFKIRIRTTELVKQGEELTIFSGPIKRYLEAGTFERQSLFRSVYGVRCACRRCQDPTELGLGSSALRCRTPVCLNKLESGESFGHLLAQSPLKLSNEAVWKCDECKYTVKQSVVRQIVDAFKVYLNATLAHHDASRIFQDFRKRVKDCKVDGLHPNHGLLANSVAIVCRVLQDQIEETRPDLLRSTLEVHIDWFKYILLIRNKVCPGLSVSRAEILYKLSMALKTKLNKFGLSLPTEELAEDYMLYMEVSKEAFEYYMDAFFLPPEETFNVFASALFTAMKCMKASWGKKVDLKNALNFNEGHSNQILKLRAFEDFLVRSSSPSDLSRNIKLSGS